jgi:hypothetical protein
VVRFDNLVGVRAHSGVPQLAQKEFVYAYANTGRISGVVITERSEGSAFGGDGMILVTESRSLVGLNHPNKRKIGACREP